LDAPSIAPDDPRLAPIVAACAEAGAAALVGGTGQGQAVRAHIAMLAVDGTGTSVAYCKQWVAIAESHRFSPGAEPAVLDVDGWRLRPHICPGHGHTQHECD